MNGREFPWETREADERREGAGVWFQIFLEILQFLGRHLGGGKFAMRRRPTAVSWQLDA